MRVEVRPRQQGVPRHATDRGEQLRAFEHAARHAARRVPGVDAVGLDEQRRAERFGQVGATVLPRMDIGRLIQVVVRCRAVISIDSGLGHLGASLGVPTLGLYGPTDALLTGTIGPRVYHLQGQAPCMPCMRRECDRYNGPAQVWQGQPVVPACFAAMPPDQVWHAVCELMAETS